MLPSALLAASLSGCVLEGTGAEPIPPAPDADSALDHGAGDAGGDSDPGPNPDAGPDAVDAGADPRVDAPPDVPDEPGALDVASDAADAAVSDAADAGQESDAGPQGPACTVPGRGDGECLDVADCGGTRSPTPGWCPGLPADVQCCTEIPAGACDPEATPQPNADSLDEAPGVGGCPDGMAPVDDFCVDQYEASLVEILSNGDEIPWSPYFNPGAHRVRAVSVAGAVPQGYISGNQAAAACDEAEKRLCSDDEWRRACNHAAAWDYPYGPDKVDGLCNEDRADHPAVEYFGTSADWIWSELGHPCLNQLEDSLAPAGAYDACVSPEGIYDLVGNLHEWTSHPDGTFRGGFYVDTYRNGIGCAYDTEAHTRGHWDYSTGFRCCADLE